MKLSSICAGALLVATAAQADAAKPVAAVPSTVTLPDVKQWNVVATYLRMASENFIRAGDAQDARNALAAADIIAQQTMPKPDAAHAAAPASAPAANH